MESEIYYNGLAHLGNAIKLQHWFYHVDYNITKCDVDWVHYQNNIYTVPVTSILSIDEVATVYNRFESNILQANIRKMGMGGFVSSVSENFMLYLFFGDIFSETTFVIIDGEIMHIEPNTLYFLNTRLPNSIHTFDNNVYFLELELDVNSNSVEMLMEMLSIY